MAAEGSRDPLADEGHGQVRVHEPVLLRECLELLDPRPGMVVVDGTIGAGGHGAAIASRLSPGGLLVGLDQDAEILPVAERALRAAGGGCRFQLHHVSFTEIEAALEAAGVATCDRVLLDLGVSSLQLDAAERGFSLMHDGPLDMRMDRTSAMTAAEWLRSVPLAELERILRDYGEERYARRVARAIDRERDSLVSTGQLRDLVARVIPSRGRPRVHPATRTFQAIRIALNDELAALELGLAAALRCLAAGGRLAVISFHSLEDRIVKRFVRAHLTPLTKKPVTASAAEVARNPRARSAKLRVGVRAV